MEGEEYSENGPPVFDVKEVKRMVDKTIDPILANNVYDAKKVNEWSQSIIDGVLKNLAAASKPFKYVVTCVIMQRCGAGLHTASASYSNPRTDSQCCVRWDNNTMHSIVTVFALRV